MSQKLLCRATSNPREEAVYNAIQTSDLQLLQKISLQSGGFDRARGRAWSFLLGVDSSLAQDSSSILDRVNSQSDLSLLSRKSVSSSPEDQSSFLHESYTETSESHSATETSDFSPHPDEHQVQLDTNRSFVLYPVVDRPVAQKKLLQEDLHDIILGVLRKRPALRYFQGYHDIITVLFLTLPLELVLPCAEKISLHRLRDSMGTGLEPLVGQIRILKRLIRLVDSSYAEMLEKNSQLPYYALSNLLTLFAHDVPTLPLIQHVFDWLLCREPIASIWLAAAVILRRKEDVIALEREGEEAMGMMHAVLSTLPPLSEDEFPSRDTDRDVSEKSLLLSGFVENTRGDTPATSLGYDEPETPDQTLSSEVEPLIDSWSSGSLRGTSPPAVSISERGTESNIGHPSETLNNSEEGAEDRSRSYSPAISETPSKSRSTSCSFPGEYKEKKSPPLPLPSLLRYASDLLAQYPPTSPELRLTETFGLQSALRTNIPFTILAISALNDDEAEACVGGDQVVLPISLEEQDEEFGPPRQSKEVIRRTAKRKSQTRSVVVRKQAVIASAVLLLGVAVVYYGFVPRGRASNRIGTIKLGTESIRSMVVRMGGLLGLGEGRR